MENNHRLLKQLTTYMAEQELSCSSVVLTQPKFNCPKALRICWNHFKDPRQSFTGPSSSPPPTHNIPLPPAVHPELCQAHLPVMGMEKQDDKNCIWGRFMRPQPPQGTCIWAELPLSSTHTTVWLQDTCQRRSNKQHRPLHALNGVTCGG